MVGANARGVYGSKSLVYPSSFCQVWGCSLRTIFTRHNDGVDFRAFVYRLRDGSGLIISRFDRPEFDDHFQVAALGLALPKTLSRAQL